jgi:hypothetical protein
MMENICFLTGRKVDFEHSGADNTFYELSIADVKVEVFICDSCIRNIKYPIPQHIISGLIANRKWPDRSFIISKEHVEKGGPKNAERIIFPDYLHSAIYPKTPVEKMDYLFLNLFDRQKMDGDVFEIKIDDERLWVTNYFKAPEECMFYINALHRSGLIQYSPDPRISMQGHVFITIEGLQKAVNLREFGKDSKKCFVAMAFNDQTINYREAIKSALNANGYVPIIIDEQNIDSDKTIPDSIIAAIKQCKFCIADFSFHRHGVYFESGFALGLGKQVIYLCEESHFNYAHFDIKQLQHIIYKAPDELESKLSNKIQAWIL